MKRNVLRILFVSAACLPAAAGYGHGQVIHVNVVDNELVVSGGVLDSSGFAERMFVESGSAGLPAGETTLSGFGPSIYWTVPGFTIEDMAENSGLFIQALARPVLGSEPLVYRTLWYWNPATQQVEVAPTNNHLQIRKSATQQYILSTTSNTDATPVRVATPIPSEMVPDNHALMLFAIHKQTAPPPGAYAFFARLTSNEYAASEPFLVVINHNVLGTQMIGAALAINAAANNSLAGDFNADGSVDAADFTVWRDELGTTYNMNHYTEWKTNFGEGSGNGAEGDAGAAKVPEPVSLLLAASGAFGLLASISLSRFRRKSTRVHQAESILVDLIPASL